MSEEKSISQQLRDARQHQEKDLEAVHRQTGISLNVLKGLESGRFDVVEPVFTRMALHAYATHLGLDADDLIERYDHTFGAARRKIQTPAPVQPSPLPLDPSTLRAIGLGVGALLLVLLLVALFDGDDPDAERAEPQRSTAPARPIPPAASIESAAPEPLAETGRTGDVDGGEEAGEAPVQPEELLAEQSSEVPVPAEIPQAAQEQPPAARPTPATTEVPEAVQEQPPAARPAPATSAGETPAAAAGTAPEALPVSGPLVLEVEAVDSTWVQVRWDEDGLFEGIVPSGERRRWEASDHFMVRSGRAHGLRYWFRDELLADGRLGDPRTVLRFRASSEGVILLGPDLQPLEPSTSAGP